MTTRRNVLLHPLGVAAAALLCFLAPRQTSAQLASPGVCSLESPDRAIVTTVSVRGGLHYSVSFHGKPLVRNSPLGFTFKDAPPLGAGVHILQTARKSHHSTWINPIGKRRLIHDQYQELRITLQETAPGPRTFDLVFRAYNDALAFRYFLPSGPGMENVVITGEDTQFRFPGDPTVWAANYGGYATAQEGQFKKQPMSALSDHDPYGVPMTIKVPDVGYAAITEADLQDWAGMYLSGADTVRSTTLYQSHVLHGGDQPNSIDVPLRGARLLRLVIGDAGDGYNYDHADWGDARLLDDAGHEVELSSLTPLSATQGFGSLRNDRSVDGANLKIGGQSYVHGLGSHSIGTIVYDLGANSKYSRFKADVGIDDEVGGRGSATFTVQTSADIKKQESGVVTRLSPRTDGQGLVKVDLPHYGPWRVLLIGNTPGELVESDAILNLSQTCALSDVSWVKPGKCAWDHWWSGDVKMDTATEEEYVAFAGEMGFPYQLVDWQWYGPFDSADSDIDKVNPALDMEALRYFAAQHGVKLFVWLHSSDVDKKLKSGGLDSVLAKFEKWGLAGIKIDFMNRDDQEMVNWYYTITRMAAAHHLMVDFHGAFKPTGMQRTYPNQITREGVMGEEYDKFSTTVTPEHDVTLPFTRMLAGPMDYTPGGFLNRYREDWKVTLPTEVMGTRCHELGKIVIYDSPLMVLCDAPEHYRGQPGLDFLKVVPTSWDDTQIVAGEVGEFIVSARKSGREWYLGGMTNDSPRSISLPLKFLGPGTFEATIYADPRDPAAPAESLVKSEKRVTSKDTLSLDMVRSGGVAIRFTPR